MRPLQYLLLFASFLFFAAPASAQIELNPFLGIAVGDQSLRVMTPTNGVDVYSGDRVVVGADLLFGAGQMAPLAGVVYRSNTYESKTAEGFQSDRLLLPLGVAYRLLAADFDLNVVLHAAVVPGVSWGADMASGQPLERGLNWAGRGGLTLYLGTVTVGAQYYHELSHDPFGNTRMGTFVVSAGGRF